MPHTKKDAPDKDAPDSDEFLAAVTKLVKDMHFYGHANTNKAIPLNVDQALRLEIIMGNIDAVKDALESGGNLDYTVKGVSNRELAQAFKNKKTLELIDEYAAKKASMRKKPKPYSGK